MTCGLRRRRPPLWMIELAEQVKLIEPGALLPTGVIVGSAVIEKVTAVESTGGDPSEAGALFRWHLVDVERANRFRKPKGHPQPVGGSRRSDLSIPARFAAPLPNRSAETLSAR